MISPQPSPSLRLSKPLSKPDLDSRFQVVRDSKLQVRYYGFLFSGTRIPDSNR